MRWRSTGKRLKCFISCADIEKNFSTGFTHSKKLWTVSII